MIKVSDPKLQNKNFKTIYFKSGHCKMRTIHKFDCYKKERRLIANGI